MAKVLSTPTLTINNVPILVIPNSVSYTEGLGEQQVKTQSAGGGSVDVVYIDNAETKFSTFKFSVFPTNSNIDLAKGWKSNGNNNAVSMTGVTEGGVYFSRTFEQAALINNYEASLSADGKLDLEWASAASA